MPDTSATRRDWLIGIALVVLFLCHAGFYLDHVIDDAYISYRYARSLVERGELTFNPGQRVEGFSNPLWVLLAAAVMACGIEDPHMLMQLLGIVLSCGTLLVTWSVGRQLLSYAGRRNSLWAAVPALLLLVRPGFTSYACSGMETPLYLFLLAAGFRQLLLLDRQKTSLRWVGWSSGILFGLACLTRPEGPYHVLVCLTAALLMNPAAAVRGDWLRTTLPRYLPLLVPCVLLWGGWMVFRLTYYGELVPNTYYAKTGMSLDWSYRAGLGYLLRYLNHVGWLPIVAIGVASLLRVRQARGPVTGWLMAVFPIVHLGGDWMPLFRFFVHTVFLEVLLTTMALIALSTAVQRFSRRLAGATGICVLLAVCALALGRSRQAVPQAVANGRAIRTRYRALGQWIYQQRQVRKVALVDVGALAFYSRAWVIDLAGLTDATIGRSPGRLTEKRYDPRYVLDQRPELIVLHTRGPALLRRGEQAPLLQPGWMFGAERRLFVHPDFRGQYRYLDSFSIREQGPTAVYVQHVFHRQDVVVSLAQ